MFPGRLHLGILFFKVKFGIKILYRKMGCFFVERIVDFLDKMFSPEIITIILGAMPISELRGAIPLALGKFHFSAGKAFSLAVLGNFLPVIPLLLFLDCFSKWCMQFLWGKKFFTWWFNRTRKHSAKIERYEVLGLIFFVAILLPVTGAWSGCAAAYLLGIEFKHAFPSIILGVLIAGIVVTLTSLGVIKLF